MGAITLSRSGDLMFGRRTLTFLGTGTSVGVPMLGCECEVCRSPDPRNQRLRCSVLISTAAGNFVIDTTPELRLQLLRARVMRLHAVVYTHYHADHLFGLDDVRPFARYNDAPTPLYCNAETEEKIRAAFAYAFTEVAQRSESAYLPRLVFQRISEEPFEVLGERLTPIPLHHAQFTVLGFRIGDLAYCTDVSKIPERSWPLLQGLQVLILDALRYKPHAAHFSLNEALEVIERVKPAKAYLTHMSHDLDHAVVSRQLPPNVEMAYDGLAFDF